MRIRISYFAMLGEEAAKREEIVNLGEGITGAELYQYLQERYSFSLPMGSLRLAVNDQFTQFDQKLRDNDHVVFIPPVAGG